MARKKDNTSPPKKRKVRQVQRKGGQLPATQKFIPFSEIRDNLVIMRDGTLRSVLLVSSLNFALKSEEEQNGIVQGYVSFINTIDFELQIVVQSRKLNVEHYLEHLDNLARQQDNELLRKQTKSYRSFVAQLVDEADIMDKKFFVVVPYSPYSNKKKNFWTRFQEVLRPASAVSLNQAKFDQYTLEMERQVRTVAAGLQGIGLETTMLDTQALIELYYNTYNPISKQQTRIQDINQMQVDRTVQ